MKRRAFLLTILAVPALSRADPREAQEAIASVLRGAKPGAGKVTLELPQLVENGNTVSMSVKVDSPMTEQDYVKAIHVFTEKNPQPYVVTFHLGPRAGRALVTTRIRLADSQTVTAIAEMSDGSFWAQEVNVIVTLAACTEVI